MIKKVVICLVLFVLIGCAWQVNPTHKYQISINPNNFTHEQAAAIMDAAADWQTATNGYVQFVPFWSNNFDPVITVVGEPTAQLEAEHGGDIGICFYHGEPSSIILSNDVDAIYLKRIALHEIGHAVGLPHLGPGTIMYPWMGCDNDTCRDQNITCEDVSVLCSIWDPVNCDALDMSPCQPPKIVIPRINQ